MENNNNQEQNTATQAAQNLTSDNTGTQVKPLTTEGFHTLLAANVEEERMHPIFDECEVNDFGVVKRHHMLSMNGMYISGITDEQLKEMHEKLTELLTGEKPGKYFYGEGSIPLKNGEVFCKRDFVIKTDGDKFPLMYALNHVFVDFVAAEHTKDINVKNAHITCCFEISEEDYEAFLKTRTK